MTFALFVGAGNIIFPHWWGCSPANICGRPPRFMVTAVALPVIAVIALARVGGSISLLTGPIGRTAGLLLATVCYLALGRCSPRREPPMSLSPSASRLHRRRRPAAVHLQPAVLYPAMIVSLYPGRLLDNVGHILAPLKISALAALGIAALVWPAGEPVSAVGSYQASAFSTGFVQGYQTMDTLSALMFGSIIVTAARSRGVSDSGLLLRYTLWASLIAGVGLTLVYICMFKLGAGSGSGSPSRVALRMARQSCTLMCNTPSAIWAASLWRY